MIYKQAFKEIMIEYDRDRQKAEYIKENRLKKVYDEIPEIKIIDKKLSRIGLKMTKIIIENTITNKNDLIDKLRKEKKYLKEKKEIILTKKGIEKDFLNNIYKCKLCKDTGYINDKKCYCFKQRLIDKYYDMSNIKDILKVENFDNFDFQFYSKENDKNHNISPRKNIENIYKICTNFVNKFPNIFTNFLFYGYSGRGKTFLCNCIAKDILDKGCSVLYITAGNLFKIIEMARFDKNKILDPYDQVNMFYTAELLIIDDLGTELFTSISQTELFNIINSRLIKKLSTIISTNLSPKDIQVNYSDRIISRLTGEYKLLKFIGSDIRISKKYSLK